jgi:hypothetical protein
MPAFDAGAKAAVSGSGDEPHRLSENPIGGLECQKIIVRTRINVTAESLCRSIRALQVPRR